MANAYFTWFGPPASIPSDVSKQRKVAGIGAVRPDIFGVKLLAAGTFTDNPPPRIKFFCLREYASAFRADLPNQVDVMPVEDQLPTKDFASLSMTEPTLDNLGATVDFVLRETFLIRMWGGSKVRFGEGGCPFNKLAFMKDMWSLYVLWKLGGYHLDCGCFPSGGAVSLPAPTTLGIVSITERGATPPHARVTLDGRAAVCSTISRGLGALWQDGVLPAKPANIGTSPMDQMLDVWCMRSNADSDAAKLALEYWLRGWFAIRKAVVANKLPAKGELYAQAHRELVMTAVMTAAAHSRPNRACTDGGTWRQHVIPTQTVPLVVEGKSAGTRMTVPSLKLVKVGFQSHLVA